MSAIEELTEQLDSQLESYEPKARWAIMIASGIGILWMGWMFFISDSVDELSALQDENAKLETQIEQSSPEAYQDKIVQTERRLAKLNQNLISLENEKDLLLSQMEQSQGLIFDNRRYAEMLDLLLEHSVRVGLKLDKLESVDTDKVFHGKIKIFKMLTIRGHGSFPAIADFMAFIENQKNLVQIEHLKIDTEDEGKPRFEATISYMGVAL